MKATIIVIGVIATFYGIAAANVALVQALVVFWFLVTVYLFSTAAIDLYEARKLRKAREANKCIDSLCNACIDVELGESIGLTKLINDKLAEAQKKASMSTEVKPKKAAKKAVKKVAKK